MPKYQQGPHYAYKDSKYSWLVCLVSFISSFMTVGYTYAIGIYFVLFRDVFETSAGTTAWVSALNYGTLSFTGNSCITVWQGCLQGFNYLTFLTRNWVLIVPYVVVIIRWAVCWNAWYEGSNIDHFLLSRL